MEFFDWLNIPQLFFGYLGINKETAAETASNMYWTWTICTLVAAGLYLSGLLCGGFGLMTMAKKQGIKYWWLGFLPFGNTYLTGKLAGETRIFGQNCKRIGLYAVIAEIIFVALQSALLVVSFLLIDERFYNLVNVTNADGEIVDSYYAFSAAMFKKECPPEYLWILTFQNVVSYIAQVWWFVLLFLMCVMFSAFFRKYYARSPFLMTFLCALLPLRGFVLLAVRNNAPLDYNEYMRRRYEQMRQQQQPPYGGQGDAPYGGYGQGGSQSGYGGQGAEDPFSEFGKGPSGNGGESGRDGSSNDSPFSDF